MSEQKPTLQLNNMLIVKSAYQSPDNNFHASFSAIPVTKDCPYIEILFDPTHNRLGVISTHSKKQFQFVPKLDGNGLPKAPNNAKVREVTPHIQERILMDTFHEYYLSDKKEIKKFIEMVAINPEFKWENYWNKEFEMKQKMEQKKRKASK